MPLPSTISDREARSATGPVALPDPASRWELEILTVVPWSGDDLLILVLVSVFFLTTGFSDQITNAVDRDSTRASSRDTTWQCAVLLVNGGPSRSENDTAACCEIR